MHIGITRRELAAGLCGVSAAGWIGLPVFGMDAAPVRLPPACRSGRIAPHLMDDADELYRLACAEWRAYSSLEQTGKDGLAWSRLYVMKVDATAALRDRLGYLASDELALRSWLAAIYQTKLSDVARADDLPHVSPSLMGPALAFQKCLLRLPFRNAAIGNGTSPIPSNAAELEAVLKGAREAAWAVLGIEPRTAGDAALHRRAAMFAADPNVARFLEAGWAGIEAARTKEVSAHAV
jgi:hypothetical protein